MPSWLDAQARVHDIADAVSAQVDLDRVLALAASAPRCRSAAIGRPRPRRGAAPAHRHRARRAFGFYYPDDLAALEAAGAALVPIDTLHDARLPAIDGLFIGGGFPEMAWRDSRPTPRCAPRCARRSSAACRPMPSAAG